MIDVSIAIFMFFALTLQALHNKAWPESKGANLFEPSFRMATFFSFALFIFMRGFSYFTETPLGPNYPHAVLSVGLLMFTAFMFQASAVSLLHAVVQSGTFLQWNTSQWLKHSAVPLTILSTFSIGAAAEQVILAMAASTLLSQVALLFYDRPRQLLLERAKANKEALLIEA